MISLLKQKPQNKTAVKSTVASVYQVHLWGKSCFISTSLHGFHFIDVRSVCQLLPLLRALSRLCSLCLFTMLARTQQSHIHISHG